MERTNSLTEIERKYLDEWIKYQEEKPTKTLLIVTWVFWIVSFVLFLVIFLLLGEKNNKILLCIIGIHMVLMILICFFTVLLLRRLKKHRTYVYDNVVRTKITKKNIHTSGKPYRGSRVKFYTYSCNGIKEYITPLSKKHYDSANVGDDITIVYTSLKPVVLGITFPDFNQ